MEWMAVLTCLLWWTCLRQCAESHPLAKPLIYKSDKLKSPVEIVYPRLHRRSVDHTLLVVRTSTDTFYIRLRPTPDPQGPLLGDRCHYEGTLLSHAGGSATVSLCNHQMSGTILTGNGAYVLRPIDHLSHTDLLEKQQNLTQGAHVLMKMENSIENFCGGDYNDIGIGGLKKSERRVRRSDSEKRKVIETAVYVDYPLYQKLGLKKHQTVEEMQNTVLTILNEVQLIYNYQSLKTKFKIVVVKLEILSEGKEAPDAADGDIDQYLDNFCSWQSTKNPPTNSDSHWDHALMLTGYDLHKVTPGNEKNKKVLGLAWVNGMCRPKHSCTLNEGSSFEAAFVIAHEMGHSLGMMHDGRGNDCDPSAFLMSEKTGPGRITWSACSNAYLDRFFQKGYGTCLEDDNTLELDKIEYRFEDQLPGERFNLEDQCKLSLGEEFKPHVVPKQPFNNVCRELWCVSGLWASVAHPALEGSSCAKGKHCMQGKCVDMSPQPSNSEIVQDMKGAVAEFLDKLQSAFHLLTS